MQSLLDNRWSASECSNSRVGTLKRGEWDELWLSFCAFLLFGSRKGELEEESWRTLWWLIQMVLQRQFGRRATATNSPSSASIRVSQEKFNHLIVEKVSFLFHFLFQLASGINCVQQFTLKSYHMYTYFVWQVIGVILLMPMSLSTLVVLRVDELYRFFISFLP